MTALLVACGGPAGDPGGDAAYRRTALTYAGTERCAACHEAEHQSWSGSHHDLAMDRATAESVLGDFGGAEFDYAGVTTTFLRRAGGFFVETDGPTGDLQEFRVAYTFGVEPLQQYLIEFPDGRLQALSICWDTRPAEAGGQRWFHLYPEKRITHDDPLHWTGRRQNWNFMCAECHSTGVRKNYDPPSNSYETTWSEIDVACEACHGPGSRHVAWAETESENGALGENDDLGLAVLLGDRDEAAWVIDRATGIASRSAPRLGWTELDTCARCHSRRSVLAPYYAHGQTLAQTHRPALLVEPLYHADGQILDEVYVYGSFIQSKMHAAGVTCGDCHDPHSAQLTRGSPDASCARCHLAERFAAREHHFHEPGTRGASCVECHMPSRDYMVLDSRHDHGFRIPRPELSVELGTPNACTGCHRDRSAEWAAGVVESWYGSGRVAALGFARALHAARTGAVDADPLLMSTMTHPDEPAIARATAASLLTADPDPRWVAAIERALVDPDPLVRAAVVARIEHLPVELRAGLGAPALSDPVRLVRVEAARALASMPPGALDSRSRGALEAGLEEYREEQLASIDQPEANANLGVLEEMLGNRGAAESALRRALEIDPGYLPAYVALADLYRAAGRDGEGERLLRQALGTAPEAAELHHALGLLLVRQRKLDEALDELAEAAARAPEVARFAYVYGVALNSAGDTGGAIEVLRGAHLRRPADRALLQALATISRDAGAYDEALGYARSLERLSPEDPGVRQLVAELARRVD